jgi:fatty-acyl-CoA synthase
MFDLIPDISAQRAQLKPDALAFRDLMRGTSLTYANLESNVQHAAGLFAANGVAAGDRVAVLCRNRPEFFELLFACAKIGAVLVPFNWRMPAGELQPLLDDAEPKLLFFGDEDSDVAHDLESPGMRSVGLDDAGPDGYVGLRDSAGPVRGREMWPGGETWYLIYTSGTTGKPKAVIQTPAMAYANYVNIRQAMSITGDDVCLNYLPLFHTAGINLVTLPTLIEGPKARSIRFLQYRPSTSRSACTRRSRNSTSARSGTGVVGVRQCPTTSSRRISSAVPGSATAWV